MIVVIFSMTVKDDTVLRLTNSLGCAMFIVYGFLIHSYPVMIMNIIVIGINMYRVFSKKNRDI